jgi:hypothetical protein
MNQDELAQGQAVLLANLEAAKRQLLDKPNTLAVGIGIKESDGAFTDDISYRVYVTEKKTLAELAPEDQVPREIMGIKTDVVTPLQIRDRPGVCGTERETLTKFRPLRAGIAISPDSTTYGTLGWFGVLDMDDSRVLLTNKHVLYDNSQETIFTSRPTAQPQLGSVSTCCCCECGSDNVIGDSLIGIRNLSPLTSTSVDCALSRITPADAATISLTIASDATTAVIQVAGTAPAVVGQTVRKIGARSGFTRGTVVHIGDVAAAPTDPAGGTISIRTGQVLVIPDPAETYQVNDRGTCKFAFSNEGDSGSVIVNADDNIVALLYGGDEKTNSVDVTVANNIQNVLDALSNNGFQLHLSVTPGRAGVHNRTAFENRQPLPLPRPSAQNYFGQLRDANPSSLLRALFDRHHREVLDLVNHRRPVTVAWHRHQGPAFVAALTRSGRVSEYSIPMAIDGITRQALLEAMEVVLTSHGSRALVSDMERFRGDVYALAATGESLEHLARLLYEGGLLDALPTDAVKAAS